MFDLCGPLVPVLYGCRSYYRIHFHVYTNIYFQYSVDRLSKKVKDAIRTTNKFIVICREGTDFSPYNCYITSAIQYFLDVFQMKLNIIRYLIVITH